jgi:hypothetical protein
MMQELNNKDFASHVKLDNKAEISVKVEPQKPKDNDIKTEAKTNQEQQ